MFPEVPTEATKPSVRIQILCVCFCPLDQTQSPQAPTLSTAPVKTNALSVPAK